MFVERGTATEGRIAQWFERVGRAHPTAFTVGLVLLAAAVTVGLLFRAAPSIVLYQGF